MDPYIDEDDLLLLEELATRIKNLQMIPMFKGARIRKDQVNAMVAYAIQIIYSEEDSGDCGNLAWNEKGYAGNYAPLQS